MISVYKTTQDGLKELSGFERDCWVDVSKPTNEELDKLSRELNIPLGFLMDPLDVDERARSEIEENDIILIVLRIPIFDENNPDVQFYTLPIGIILIEDTVVTICSRDNDVVSGFINNRVRNFSTTNKNRFILQIMYRSALLYLNYLKEINRRSSSIENELHRSMKNEEVIRLLSLEKSLVYFTTSLRSNELMIDRLQRMELLRAMKLMDPPNEDLLEDVIIETKQAIEMANIYSNILSGMMDAFASVISNNLNVVIKILTAITIIVMLPTLVVGIFSMNVKLPLQQYPHAFLIIMIMSLASSMAAVWYSIKRKWLS